MKFLESFTSFFKKDKPEEFKGKTQTYRFSDITDEGGNRMGTCKECGKRVDITEHSEEVCLKEQEQELNESANSEDLKLSILSGIPETDLLHSHPNYYNTIIYPPVEAEEQSGINGLSKTYKMPFNLTDIEVENIAIIFRYDEEVIKHLYKGLIRLNPELPKSEDIKNMYHIILGACSKFLPIDIKDYIEHSVQIEKLSDSNYIFKRKDQYSITYELLYNSVINMGLKLKWFPSLHTLDFIYKKLKQTI